jgi:hypothetical protein
VIRQHQKTAKMQHKNRAQHGDFDQSAGSPIKIVNPEKLKPLLFVTRKLSEQTSIL